MDENKKVVVNLPEGTTQAEIIVREEIGRAHV